ncbi:hypothetical protein CSA37_01420 [Candidatus Fermentibacteria bacterium]|nr:MAG: hypothetical protein CSA37_01420 [Candidatus Fermentibacteria bacterium]
MYSIFLETPGAILETLDILKTLTNQTGTNHILAAEAFRRIEELRPILLEAVEYAASNSVKVLKTDSICT